MVELNPDSEKKGVDFDTIQQMDRYHLGKEASSIATFVYKIETPNGQGSGFQMFFGKENRLLAIVTARHVIESAYKWDFPIILSNYSLGIREKIYRKEDRVIRTFGNKDIAVIILNINKFDSFKKFADKDLFHPGSINYLKRGQRVIPGSSVGWLGFPSIIAEPASQTSFFAGHISSFNQDPNGGDYYLIDGNAIHGVSGGPVFGKVTIDNNSLELFILGVMVAYKANIRPEAVYPGVSKAILIGEYEEEIKMLQNLEDARKKEKAEKDRELNNVTVNLEEDKKKREE